jgi:hypothetical protein
MRRAGGLKPLARRYKGSVDDIGELERLKKQARDDRKLFQRAAQVLAEIDRSQGLSDEHADVLAALRIRVEGKERASLEELLGAAGDISGKRDLGDLLGSGGEKSSTDWPEVPEKKREWPGL